MLNLTTTDQQQEKIQLILDSTALLSEKSSDIFLSLSKSCINKIKKIKVFDLNFKKNDIEKFHFIILYFPSELSLLFRSLKQLSIGSPLRIFILTEDINPDDSLKILENSFAHIFSCSKNNAIEIENCFDKIFSLCLIETPFFSRKSLSQKKQQIENQIDANKEILNVGFSKFNQEKKTFITNNNQLKSIIQFLKRLESHSTPPELLLFFQKEVLKFKDTKSVILFFEDHYKEKRFFKYRGTLLLERNIQNDYCPNLNSIRVNISEDRHFYANLFGRPFNKTIGFPIQFGNDLAVVKHCAIVIEHNISKSNLDDFFHQIEVKLKPFSIALERSLIEFYLKSETTQWEKTFDGISDPILIVDNDYNIIRSNKSFAQESIIEKCFSAFQKNNKTCPGCPIPKTLQSNQMVTSLLNKGNKTYQVYSYPIQSNKFSPQNLFVNFYQDDSESRKLYGQAIQNEKLAAIGNLAGNIAHELNNPLTGIQSMAQLLIKELQPTRPELCSDLLEIESASKRCQKIIVNFIEFTKQSCGNSELINLIDLIHNTIPFLKTALKKHQIIFEFEKNQLTAYVESSLFQQVIYNLINNACQAMPESGKILVHGSIEKQNSMLFCKIQITDNGLGISKKDIPLIFDPFFTTKEEGFGTGLGLTVSKSVIEKFNGTLSVESQLNQGTTFTLLIPFKENLK